MEPLTNTVSTTFASELSQIRILPDPDNFPQSDN